MTIADAPSLDDLRRLARAERRRQELVERTQCEDSLYEFVKLMWHAVEPATPFVSGWVLEGWCEHLEAVTDGTVTRVLGNVPPGTTKSLVTDVFWPAWEWGPRNRPHLRYLCTAYGSHLTERDNRRFRQVVTSDVYQRHWGHRFALTGNSVELIINDKTGWKLASSVGGISTGERADRVICFPKDVRVLTDRGWVEIGKIVDGRESVRIAGWNGSRIVWQNVIDYEKSPGKSFVTLWFDDGSHLRCTPEHPIRTSYAGWVPAGAVKIGESVCTLRDDVSLKAESLGEANILRDGLSRCGSQGGGTREKFQTMPVLRNDGLSHSGAFESHTRRSILQSCVPRGMEPRGTQPSLPNGVGGLHMQALRSGVPTAEQGCTAGDILLSKMSGLGYLGQERPVASQGMPLVQGNVPASEPISGLLLASVLECGPQLSGCLEGEWPLGSWGSRTRISSRMDPVISKDDTRPRRAGVSDVWVDPEGSWQGVVRPSYRLRQRQPCANEPNNALPVLSRQDARIDSGTAGLASKNVIAVEWDDDEEPVFNLNVEPCHNYFADGVLVHNCDDPNRPPTDEDGGETSSVMKATAVWFREVMPDRLNNLKDSAIVVIQQRLAEIDVSGTILSLGLAPLAEQWEPGDYVHYMVPMEYDPLRHCETVLGWSDPRGLDDEGERLPGLIERSDGRVELDPNSELAERDGEIAWPERFDEQALIRLKQLKGIFGWAGQYQQRPAPREGGIIKAEQWLLWSGDFPTYGTCIASLDTAYKENEKADYNAMTVWAAFEHPETEKPKLMLRDAWQVRCTLSELVKKVIATCYEHKVDTLVIEDKTRGGDVADEIYRMIGRREMRIELIVPAGDKVSRLESVEPLFSNGMIYAPDREWAQMVIDQVSVFPRGRHDDLCFAAGTLIATDKGDVPIETIRVGDRVVTPVGFCQVLAAGSTGVALAISRGNLIGTAQHPVFVLGSGYQPLYNVCDQNKLSRLTLCGLTRLALPKQWSLWELSTAAWAARGNTISRNQHQTLVGKELKDCMSRSGSISQDEKCRLSMKSIIKIMIRLISIMRTWNAYRRACIAACLRTLMLRSKRRIWRAFDLLLPYGIVPQPALNGTVNMLPRVSASVYAGLWPSKDGCVASGAEQNAIFECPVGGGGAARNANCNIPLGSVGDKNSVTPTLCPVYNMTVEGANCYYANGVLVHNCDSASQGLSYLRKTGVALRRDEHDDMVRERRMFKKQTRPLYDV